MVLLAVCYCCTSFEVEVEPPQVEPRKNGLPKPAAFPEPRNEAVEEDGFALQALLPETDAPLLQSLEALLQTEHPDSLGKGRDVSKKYGNTTR